MPNRSFVFIESNTTGTGRQFVSAAHTLGLRPVLLAAEPDRYPFAGTEVDTFRVDTSTFEKCLEACRSLRPPTAGVMSSSEYFVDIASAVASRLGLPSLPHAAVLAARDKNEQRERLAAHGVPVPRFQCVRTPTAAEAAAKDLGCPVVVKPVAGSGSVGVALCGTAAEARDWAGQLLANPVNERGYAVESRVLIEEHISGPEFSAEIFGDIVVGITTKHLGEPPTFIETGHDFPARHVPSSVAATALAAASALGLNFGPLHAELRLTNRGPVLIEVNPRLAGGCIPTLVAAATGVNLLAETVRAFAGGIPRLTPTRDLSASIRFVLTPADGIFGGLAGADRVSRLPEVVEAIAYRSLGERVVVTGDFRRRIGHVITCDLDPVAAACAAERALVGVHPIVQQERRP